MKAKRYYNLVVKFKRDDKWSVQYGSYNRSEVIQEIEDSYSNCYRARVLGSDDSQDAINAAVAKLNA